MKINSLFQRVMSIRRGVVRWVGIFTAIFISSTVFAQADSQQIYLACLTNFETYAETIWHTASYPGAPPDSGYWGDGGSNGNGGIRGSSGIAVAYAALVVAQPDSPRTSLRLSRIRQALNYDVGTHITGNYNCVDGHQWGWSSSSSGDWQTAMWSGSMGFACLLVQSNLPDATVQDVRRVVASEADHRAAIAPASGYVSDTKAEENAWDGNILALAAAWLSPSNHAPTWLAAAKSYLANTYTVANTVGDPLADWISTVTLYPDFALENHGFYHPTYEMVAGMSSGDSLLMAKLANPGVAGQLLPFAEHNVQTVWNTNLSLMLLDSGEFAYPSGLDWELHDYEQNSYIAWMAAHFNDPLARWADGELAQLVRYRQIVNGNGEFVGPSGGGFYREAVEARRTAIAWLQWSHADFPTGPTNAPQPAVAFFPDVGVIAQRSPWSFVSISYKDKIMGIIEAASDSVPTNAFVTTPALPGGFGNGGLGNATSAALVNFMTNSTGFTAQLLLKNGANGQTRVYVSSCGESVGIVEIPLPAADVTGTSAGCFTNGIENDPLTGGTRLIEWNGGSVIVTNFSRASTNIASRWVCISGRYGVATGPDGSFSYRAAGGYNRLGAAQDYLSVTPQTPLGARYCVWFPTKNAAQTAALANQISWTTNGSTVVLNFPGRNDTQTIVASLAPAGNGTWDADASGNWSDSTKWLNGNIADGAGNTADFSALDITADRVVTLDSPRTIGALNFGDTSGAQNWVLDSSGGSILTLAANAPAIAVENNTVTINAALAGISGFMKSGPGTLVLSGSNSISGIVYLDSNSTRTDDGAVKITGDDALAGATSLSIRNNNGGSSTLQLDGSTGNITLQQNISLAGRNVETPAIENIAGDNTISGNLALTVGGGFYRIQSDGGTLTNSGTFPVSTPSGTRVITFMGNGNHVVTGTIQNGTGGGTVALLKTGNGSLTLNGVNTYTGATTISNGIFGGAGTIAGPVTVLLGAILSPGNAAIGALTINNALTNFGTISVRLKKLDGILTNDSIIGVSDFSFGGTLNLTTIGEPITAGDSFKLFDAASYHGAFTNITPTVPGVGLVWNTGNLLSDGVLKVALGAIKPRVDRIFMDGTNLIWTGSGGAAAAGYSILTATNLTLPITAWNVIGDGVFDVNGQFIVTNEPTAKECNQFYIIRTP